MALTRKLLKGMGLTEEQVDTIIEAHTETVEGLKNEVSTYKAEAAKVPGLQRQVEELEGGDGEDWKGKYDAEKAAHDKTKSDYQAKETAAENERLFRAELTGIGITGKRADQIVKMTDLTTFKVKDGAYEDAKSVQDHIRTEWSEFIPSTKTEGANVPTPPGNGGGKLNRADIAKIKNPAERRAAIAANPELFKDM